MPFFLPEVILLFYLMNFSSQYDLFWTSARDGINVVDNGFGKDNKFLQKVNGGLSRMLWGFTVDQTLPESSAKMGFRTKNAGKLKKLKAVKKLEIIGNELYDGNISLVKIDGRMVERGDFDPVIKRCDNNNSDFRVIVVLTKKWKKNDYGEISIYDQNEELIKSIHPKYGRAVFLPCKMDFKISPPSINVIFRHYFLFAEFGSPQSSKPIENNPGFSQLSLGRYLKENIKFDDIQYKNMNPENYTTRKFYSSDGKKIFVYDNAIPKHTVDAVRNFITNHADYFEEPVVQEGSADNVKWIISFDEPGFQQSPLWIIMKQLLHHIAGKTFYPYDISCNHIRRTDTTKSHKDIYSGDEYTVLLYLNPNFNEDDYGETGFYENGEVIATVLPKYGRVAIFDGKIDHSAHPSSPTLAGARYTLAIKTAPSIETAMNRFLGTAEMNYTKILEIFEKFKQDGNPSQQEIANDILAKLYSGQISDKDTYIIRKFLNTDDNNE